jgi:anaerobic selenocysteine-containing dehydrogenase
MLLTVDADDRIVKVQGDGDHPVTKGYACFKGIQAVEAHHGPSRLLRPLKRRPHGGFEEIGLEQALDEIADKLRPYYERGEKDAIGVFNGNGASMGSAAHGMFFSFMPSLGSSAHYTTLTIDQSAKCVAFERLGGWAAGVDGIDQSEVSLIFGANPVLSHALTGFLFANPARRLKQARARGLKLIVVDPRRTDTGRHADLLLQPIPGQDSAIAAALIRIIMDEGWGDSDFTDRFATPEGMAGLRAAVEPFTEAYVERRAGLKPGDLRAVAEMFARDHKRGAAYTATGPSMAPYSNLAQHLVDALNVVCGRFRRAGEPVTVDMVQAPYPIYEEAISPPRSWEAFPAGRVRGVGRLAGERLTATIADEILVPGDGRLRCLIVAGANPMTSVPDTLRMREALQSLDVLVVIDPYLTETAKQADYILPPRMQYERPDLPISLPGFALATDNWSQYAPAAVDPPEGSEVCDDWYPFWAIAKRLGFSIDYLGKGPLPMDAPPTTEDLLAIRLQGARVSFDELKRYPSGHVWDVPDAQVQPARPGATGRFELMPADVADELNQFIGLTVEPGRIRSHGREFSHLLTCRRTRNVNCSIGTNLARTRKRLPYNPAYLHPDDLRAIGAEAGDAIRITSDHGSIQAIVAPDENLRPGVLSISHGWGGEPVAEGDAWDGAANVNLLIASDRDVEAVNAMPRMSAIPVNIERINAALSM